jgi:hypothetical protein
MLDASPASRVIGPRLGRRIALGAMLALLAVPVLALGLLQDAPSAALGLLAVLPGGAILATPLWRQRIRVDAEWVRVTPAFGRVRQCRWCDVAACGRRVFDPLMLTEYLDLYADPGRSRLLLSISLAPLSPADQHDLQTRAERAVCTWAVNRKDVP